MEIKDYAVGIDIGTTKIVVIVGRKNANGKIDIMGVGRCPSNGIVNGVVNNIPRAIESIKKAIEDAQKMANVPVKDVVVGIAGKHIRSMQHSDYIIRDNPEEFISEEDLQVLKDQVAKLQLPPAEQILHILPQDFRIDSEGDIFEPIGMHGKRLEANFHVVIGRIASIQNIVKCIEESGLNMIALTLEPLASAESVLSEEEKEAGVAIIDIGGGTTDIAIFKDNIIRHTAVIPYGGKIITEDIKSGCSLIERDAEQLKVQYGSVDPDSPQQLNEITIKRPYDMPSKVIKIRHLAQIIRARFDEILNEVQFELKSYGIDDPKKKLISGLVLTGGGANMKNIRQITRYKTDFDTRVGVSNQYVNNDRNNALAGPEYATSIGLLMEGLKIAENEREIAHKLEELKLNDQQITENQTVEQIAENEQIIRDTGVSNLSHSNQNINEDLKKAKLTIGQKISNKFKFISNLLDDSENVH